MSDNVNAMIYTPAAVEINGVKYQRRRMGIDLEVRLAELLFNALGSMDINVEKIDGLSVGEIGGLLILLLQRKEFVDDLLGFLRDLLVDFPLSVKEMHDSAKFPMGSELRIIESVVNDEDAKDFFAIMQRLLKLRSRLKGARKKGKRTRSRSKSTSSKKGTAGRKKK